MGLREWHEIGLLRGAQAPQHSLDHALVDPAHHRRVPLRKAEERTGAQTKEGFVPVSPQGRKAQHVGVSNSVRGAEAFCGWRGGRRRRWRPDLAHRRASSTG